MNTKFFYALILTVCSIVLNLLLFFTGFQTEKLAVGQHLGWLGFVAMAAVLWFGVKAVRDDKSDTSFTYGQGVGAGVLISLYSGLMNSVYTFIHFKFINTSFADYMMEIIRGKWAAQGLTEAQMERAEGFTRMMFNPVIQAVMAPIGAVVVGLVLSLIIAAILKRKLPAAGAENVPPPVATT
jgi:hypothetical protein